MTCISWQSCHHWVIRLTETQLRYFYLCADRVGEHKTLYYYIIMISKYQRQLDWSYLLCSSSTIDSDDACEQGKWKCKTSIYRKRCKTQEIYFYTGFRPTRLFCRLSLKALYFFFQCLVLFSYSLHQGNKWLKDSGPLGIVITRQPVKCRVTLRMLMSVKCRSVCDTARFQDLLLLATPLFLTQRKQIPLALPPCWPLQSAPSPAGPLLFSCSPPSPGHCIGSNVLQKVIIIFN